MFFSQSILAIFTLSVSLTCCAAGIADLSPRDLFLKSRAGDQQAFSELKARAEREDAASQYEIGRLFSFGTPFLKGDEERAAIWVRKAAEAGNLEAQTNLGYLYLSGRGITQDNQQAMLWMAKAAEGGFAQAQMNLGILLQEGKHASKDEARALYWMEKAANQGLAKAQLNMGYMHGLGVGTTPNDKIAMQWYMRAAEQGDETAMINIGLMFLNGEGVQANPAEALKWLKRPALNKNPRAAAGFLRICKEHPALCEK